MGPNTKIKADKGKNLGDCNTDSWLDSLHYPKAERYKDLRKAIAFLNQEPIFFDFGYANLHHLFGAGLLEV